MILGELLRELVKTNGIVAAAYKGRTSWLFVSRHLRSANVVVKKTPDSYLIV